jgi:hypothetical protein
MPSQLAHQLRQAAAGACATAALRNFQNVEDGLRADPLDAVVTNFPAKTFQAEPPWVILSRNRISARLLQHT